LADEVVLLHERIAGVGGSQTGSLERHLASALTLRQTGGGNGSNDHFGSDDWWENGGTQVRLETELKSEPLAFRRHWARRVALGGDRRAFTSRGADTATAIEDQAFRAWMAGDAGAFADQILVTRFVVWVDDVSDSLVAPFESRVAEAFVTFTDNAVDAAVSAAGNGRQILANGRFVFAVKWICRAGTSPLKAQHAELRRPWLHQEKRTNSRRCCIAEACSHR